MTGWWSGLPLEFKCVAVALPVLTSKPVKGGVAYYLLTGPRMPRIAATRYRIANIETLVTIWLCGSRPRARERNDRTALFRRPQAWE